MKFFVLIQEILLSQLDAQYSEDWEFCQNELGFFFKLWFITGISSSECLISLFIVFLESASLQLHLFVILTVFILSGCLHCMWLLLWILYLNFAIHAIEIMLSIYSAYYMDIYSIYNRKLAWYKKQGMATLGDIGVAAGINILSALVFLVAFAILRLQPYNDRVYFPKWYLKGLRSSPEHSGTYVSKFVNLEWRSYVRFLNWVPDALRMPEPELIDHAGLDSSVYLRIYLLG